MDTRLSIGDFSRMTFLSVKTLRHYHDVGLLAPAEIDPHSGYRYYRATQVGDAQLIRRLRDLQMPVPSVREVMAAPDHATRDSIVAAHLDRMTQQLQETQATVDSLRRLLVGPAPAFEVTTVLQPDMWAFVVREVVDDAEAAAWWVQTFTSLHGRLAASGVARTGPDGMLFPLDYFTESRGELVAFLPVPEGTPGASLVGGTRLATTTYDGPFVDLDTAYGALGTAVLERAMGGDGPVWERYITPGDKVDLMDHTTVIGWPVGAAGSAGKGADG